MKIVALCHCNVIVFVGLTFCALNRYYYDAAKRIVRALKIYVTAVVVVVVFPEL